MVERSGDPETRDDSVLIRPEVQRARAFLQAQDPWILERQMELTAIPAPPFAEEKRGRRMAQLFREIGLDEVERDQVGNVLAKWEPAQPGKPGGKASGAALVVSAHLDTVFPDGTRVTPRVDGDRIYAPGISDDGRGLAALLGLARTLVEVPTALPFPVLFVATVGEEGPGNLRGVRHLFGAAEEGRWLGFISLDGTGMDRIICRGIGSLRFRITLKGNGGHSWTDFGVPNPIHILGRIVARLSGLDLPDEPRTTLTVARWGGGTSINSIPQEAWFEADIRSEGMEGLQRLDDLVQAVIDDETGGPNLRSGTGSAVSVIREEIGRRPAGKTRPDEHLVRCAVEATRALGQEAQLSGSSTDANVPMALGVPAITMGAGGTGGGIHTLSEWYENRKGPEGIFRALLTLILFGDRM